MILRDFPDLPPRPPNSGNEAFRRWFYSRWGRENAVICASASLVEYAVIAQALSIKTAWHGAEHYLLGSRRISVDDDCYLVLNSGGTYGSMIDSRRPVGSFCVFFRPGMAAQAFGARLQSADALLDAGENTPAAAFDFAQHLRPHDRVVTPLLRRLRAEIDAGADDEQWLEERLQELLAAMIVQEPGVRQRALRLKSIAASTHEELTRRLGWAADFMLGSYAEPISLDDIAVAARLSKFHLLRLFRRVYGVTPWQFLLRKRGCVARRLLEDGELPIGHVADAAGFGSRSAMFRQLRAQFGRSAGQLRGRVPRPGEPMDDSET